jgi:predicted Zn-dependent protease
MENTTGWHRVGRLLMQVNQFDEAIQVFNDLLDRASNDSQRTTYYNRIDSVYGKMVE